MNNETISKMKEKLEGAKFGIVCTNKGITVEGIGMDLLNSLSNIVSNLNNCYPKELIMLAVKSGLEHNESYKEKKQKSADELDKIKKIVEMLKELQ